VGETTPKNIAGTIKKNKERFFNKSDLSGNTKLSKRKKGGINDPEKAADLNPKGISAGLMPIFIIETKILHRPTKKLQKAKVRLVADLFPRTTKRAIARSRMPVNARTIKRGK